MKEIHYTETTLHSKTMYNGLIVKVRLDTAELHNGKSVPREVVEHPGGVAVVPIDETGNVIAVRQFRYPLMKELLEVPAGKLEYGEDPWDCAMRELREETGVQAERWEYLGCIYPSPGFSAETLYIYLARGLTQGQRCPDENEFLNVETISLEEMVRLIMADEVRDAKTIAAILKAKEFLQREKQGG